MVMAMKRKTIMALGGRSTSIRGTRAINWDTCTKLHRYFRLPSVMRIEAIEAVADVPNTTVRESAMA